MRDARERRGPQMRQNSVREGVARMALALLATQVGTSVGRAYVDGWRFDWYMLIPMGFIGLLAGAALTPSAWLPMCALMFGTCGYILFAVSRWWCVLLSGLSGVVIAIVTRAWRS